MRNAFAEEMTRIAAERKDLVLLSGDIGNKLFDQFKNVAPDRFFNCGVAEANMMSVAAGMALTGLRPVVYTITPFITARCLEQIRNDVCYHDVPVVIVGVGSGLGYASLGPTHHSCEDIAMLRCLPNMTVVCPADPLETRALLCEALNQKRPTYLRIGKKGEPAVHKTLPALSIGQALPMRDGTDACLLSTGVMLPIALEAAEALAEAGISTGVINFHTVKPLDEGTLHRVFTQIPIIATIEEHSIIGGLGSAVAEWLADHCEARAQLCRIGTNDAFFHESGGTRHARSHFGLTAKSIAGRIQAQIENAV